jgi:general secretion pathway protein F
MGAFEYVAMDQAGKQNKGLLEGDTPKHVRQILRDRNLLPVSVTEVAQKEARRQSTFSLRRGISSGELALITRQLASLTQSGLPLEESLLAVAQQNDQPRTKSILLGVRAKVMEGHALADGFSEFPQAFPELYRATVASGRSTRASGRLHGGSPGAPSTRYKCHGLPDCAGRHGCRNYQLHARDCRAEDRKRL